MADLIDSSTHASKPNLVKAIYPSPISNEILSLPISTIGADADRQVWKHSSSGDYQVKKAYNLLSRNTDASTQTWWHVIWKVRVPLKICNMVWRLLHDNLPTFHTLRNRGIPVSSTCPLCDEVEETTSHLFLFCSFTRAVGHGTSLAVHTSDLRNCSAQIWIDKLLQIHKKLEPENLNYLQGIFTTLWSIWTHRNLVVHEGKHPNLLEVVLTSQSFISRYKEAFFSHGVAAQRTSVQLGRNSVPQKPWQLIIKVAGVRAKKLHRASFAYEARNLQGEVILQRVSSCTEKVGALLILEAMVDAVIKAKGLGYNFILSLSDSWRFVLVSNRKCRPLFG